MARRDKHLQRMRNNPAGDWRYAQLAAALTRAGFHEVSSEGSHRTWVGPRNVRITLRDDGGRGVLPIYVRRTVAAIDAAQDE